MKRVCLVVLIILLCVSAFFLAKAENTLETFLDIPFGITLNEACTIISDKLGISLEIPSNISLISTDSLSIHGLDCKVVIGDKDVILFSQGSIYSVLWVGNNDIGPTSASISEKQTYVQNYLNSAKRFLSTLTFKYGQPLHAYLRVASQSEEEQGILFDIPMVWNSIDMAIFEKNKNDVTDFIYLWNDMVLEVTVSNYAADDCTGRIFMDRMDGVESKYTESYIKSDMDFYDYISQ